MCGRALSAATVMFHTAVADRMGLSVTDHKCLDLARRAEGPVTAGRIAELSGLSTGAVTGVIDRLERAKFVRRVRDPHDRRKVLVEVLPKDTDKYSWIFQGLRDACERAVREHGEDEIELIISYLTRMTETLHSETKRVREYEEG
ncbi:MarR family transcriptional regulator [Allokutzneria sp. A3M-2-11 16]|uniref:MarR family winged helix-turn-helix transcriptional regulator n=1 Tax=Allokutzneria sp. A3M-2-11 16 TaxID=2962043 RepID=UPI0020B6A5FA|nr:MarR family transcriptional regulator [Allokutzneria sp. A3M-2-11 16]MCP3800099.1 MarR family transcriptional regulator [Allokutzneria sp. A3M-2-11 16]